MARVAGVNIPDNKHAEISLTYVYGIGKTRAQDICGVIGIDPSTKISDLSEDQLELIRAEHLVRIFFLFFGSQLP